MLDLKLLRDLRNMKGQMTAVVLVMACGLTMMIMARGLVVTLETTERNYYTSSRFADLFCDLKRAPRFVETRLGEISGVAALETSVKGTVVLDLPGELHLPVEARDRELASGEVLSEDLEGDLLVEEAVPDAVDRSHASDSEQTHQLVASGVARHAHPALAGAGGALAAKASP